MHVFEDNVRSRSHIGISLLRTVRQGTEGFRVAVAMRTSSGAGHGALHDRYQRPSWGLLSATLLVMTALNVLQVTSSADPFCPEAFWNFGDSLTDTGGTINVFPRFLDPERRPYGESFFGRPAKRWCNGRVVPDFFSLAFEKPLLQPYLQAGAFDYRFGANYASAGTTASNDTSRNSIFLAFQVAEHERFRQTAISEKDQFLCSPFRPFLPVDQSYSKGLYTFEFGGNDILNSLLLNNRTPADIVAVVIPEAMVNIANGIKTLYNNGARQFLFFNAPNAGCSTIVITLLGTFPRDSLGCVALVNDLDRAYNAALAATIATARQQYTDAYIDIFRYYDANEEILRNPTRYGFNPALTKTACCGAGPGILNYNPLIPCGAAGSNKCSNPDAYVNWDGVHFTEAFYRVITRFALDGNYTDFGFNYTANCDLSFRNFGPNATFNSVYGNTCKVTFLPS